MVNIFGTRTNGKPFHVTSRKRIPEDARYTSFRVRPPGSSKFISFNGPDVTVIIDDDKASAKRRYKAIR